MLKKILKNLKLHTSLLLPFVSIIFLFWLTDTVAQSSNLTSLELIKQEIKTELQVSIDTIWVIFTASLVFFMNAGFALLETGFCRQKNTVNILSKNLIVFAIATVSFWAVGFGLMFGFGGDWTNPNAADNGFIGLHGFFLQGQDNSPATNLAYQGIFPALSWTGVPLSAKFFFELVFAGTAATIISGAVAERIKFVAFFLFSIFLVGICYPITGHWIWGGGWLAKLGFYDFAGSTAVHSVGGWAGLVGAAMLGPRIGKYVNGQAFGLPGHNLTISTLGCFILWLGWFGFNPGSTMAVEPQVITHILVVTNMAAAMGGIAATLTSWWYFGKPDLSVIINGIMAGLVAITASCRFVPLGKGAIIGIIAGVIVVFAVDFFDNLKIDDPVGAISVHLIGGIWGTLAVALFALGPDIPLTPDFILYTTGPAKGLLLGGGLAALRQILVQFLGITTVSCFTIVASWIGWSLIQLMFGLRVSPQAEIKGLDISEHGLNAYSDFLVKQDDIPEMKNIFSTEELQDRE